MRTPRSFAHRKVLALERMAESLEALEALVTLQFDAADRIAHALTAANETDDEEGDTDFDLPMPTPPTVH
jgi:hypothetical protein